MSAHDQTRHLPYGESPRPGNAPIVVLRTAERARPAVPVRTLIEISHRLRPRDYTIAVLLDEHTTLTTDQICAILFHNVTTCRHRLHALRQLGFLDRFIRNRPWAPNPVCWVPGLLSARYSALARGDAPPTPRALRQQQDAVYSSPKLEHDLAARQFFVNLLAHARRHPDTRLARWWSERTTAAAHGRRIEPDGHGVWVDGDRTTGFFLELDRGTESLRTKVVAKLAGYRRLRDEGGPNYPVLFVVPSRLREQNLHRRLAERGDSSLTVATTCPEAGANPAGPVWRVAGNGRHRLTLGDLATPLGQAGPLHPGPPTPEQDPLHLLAG